MLILPSAAAKRTLPEQVNRRLCSNMSLLSPKRPACIYMRSLCKYRGCEGFSPQMCISKGESEYASGVPAFDGSELCCWADRTLTGWISSGGTGAFQTSSGQSTSRTSELNSRLPASKLTSVLETRDVREVESNPCPHDMCSASLGA